MRLTDVPRLAKLADELLPSEASTEKRTNTLKRSLENPNYDLFVGTAGGQVVGLLDLWSFPDFGEGSDLCVIQNLIVTSNFRRRGVAGALVEKALAQARRRRAREVHVSTTFRNKAALRFYRKHGFTKMHAWLERKL